MSMNDSPTGGELDALVDDLSRYMIPNGLHSKAVAAITALRAEIERLSEPLWDGVAIQRIPRGVPALRARVGEMEAENEGLRYPTWPQWARSILSTLQEFGWQFDDDTIDLPEAVSDWLREYPDSAIDWVREQRDEALARAERAEAALTASQADAERLAEFAKWLRDTIDTNITVNSEKEHRLLLEGEYHTGTVVNWAHKLLTSIRECAHRALVAAQKDTAKPINWRDDPDAIVEDDEPQIGRDYE